VESLDGVKARTRSRLRRLVPTAADALRNWEARDRALLLVADAEVDRVLGDRTSALAKLADAQAVMTSDPGGAGLREWLEAVARAGGDRGLVDRVRADAIMRLQQPGMGPEASAGLAAALGHATGPTLDAELEEILFAAATRVSQRRRDSHWEGGIAEVLARSARERGALDDAEAHTLHAARVYDRLGDPRSRDRLLASPHAASELRAWPDDGALDVVIGLTEGTFHMEIREPGHEPARAALQDAELAHVLATSSASGWGEAYSRPLAKRMAAAPDSLRADLWRALDTPPMREALSREGDRDLRLRLRDPRLEAAPWELAGAGDERLSDHPSIRCLYRGAPDALPNVIEIRSLQAGLRIAGLPVTEDGTLGPETRRALEGYQRRERLPATGHPDPFTVQRIQGLLCSERSVTVVRNGAPIQGGGRARLGSPVERLYSTLGFQIEALAGTEAGIEALETRPTAILHFATPLVETGGSVGLDVAGDPYASWSRGEGDWLTAAALDQAFQTPLPAPIVILDPPLAGSRVDAVTTLLLRNTFAGELFALGNTRAVFGVGLASLEKQSLLHRALIEPIASGASFGETIQNVRQLAEFAGSTLHARSAEMLPPWR
jgi:hypothetical protein